MSNEAPILDRETLIAGARRIHDRRLECLAAVERADADRKTSIIELHQAEVPWTEIGRIFDISPQAAMYASGLVQRTPKKKGATKTPRKPRTAT